MLNEYKLYINTFYIKKKYKIIRKYFTDSDIKILDIGAGNHSAKKMKIVFPECKYYGVDISPNYNNDDEDFQLMEKFFELDLTKLDYEAIEENYYDLIVMSHIIEHLYNGDLVLEKLINKLKSNGIIYLEFPGFRSTKFPSMAGTLNFFDDGTHIRIYSLKEIYNILLRNNVTPLKGGIRRNYSRIMLLPIILPYRLIKNRKLLATDFWDLFGFAEYVLGRKK